MVKYYLFRARKIVMEGMHTCLLYTSASLSNILSAQPTADSLTVTEHLCEQYDPSCFAHVLVVTDRGQDDRLIGNTVFSYLEPPKEKENVYAEI